MATELQIKLSSDSDIAFSQAVAYMEKELSMDARKILTLGGVSYAQAARNMTPTARKNAKREIVVLNKRGQAGPRFGVVKLSQRLAPQIIPIRNPDVTTQAQAKREDIAAVPNVRAAKNSWYGVMRSLNKPVPISDPVMRAGTATHEGTAAKPAVRIINRIGYLLKIAPNVDREAKRKAAKDIATRVEIAVAKRWRRK
jgi:hypothetical protein